MRGRAVGKAWFVAIAGAASVLGACAAGHLAHGYGASREAFRAQIENQTPARAPDVTGLDSQEAAIIADGYRQSLARKGEKAQEEPVILLTPEKAAQRAPLAPSVPK